MHTVANASLLTEVCRSLDRLAHQDPDPGALQFALWVVEEAQSACWRCRRCASVNRLAIVRANLVSATHNPERAERFVRRARDYAAARCVCWQGMRDKLSAARDGTSRRSPVC